MTTFQNASFIIGSVKANCFFTNCCWMAPTFLHQPRVSYSRNIGRLVQLKTQITVMMSLLFSRPRLIPLQMLGRLMSNSKAITMWSSKTKPFVDAYMQQTSKPIRQNTTHSSTQQGQLLSWNGARTIEIRKQTTCQMRVGLICIKMMVLHD